VFLAYVDDSGNIGRPGSRSYTLACVLVGGGSWLATLDQVIAFRRELKAQYGVPITAEIKANHLLRNKGMFFRLGLNEATRRDIYRGFMEVQTRIGVKTFAIVIDKDKLAIDKPDSKPREIAWEYLIQRLGATSGRLRRPVLLLHDEGEEATIRKIARKARRAGTAGSHFGTGLLKRPVRYLIDDPVARDSRHSYFVQLADLNAYAAFRRLFPPPPRLVQIVPQGTWDELGRARYKWANRVKGGIPGLVPYP